jgi:hypothetical protein
MAQKAVRVGEEVQVRVEGEAVFAFLRYAAHVFRRRQCIGCHAVLQLANRSSPDS